MRSIKTKQDIVTLRRAGVLSAALVVQVEDYFNQLRAELDDEDESEFRLGRNGSLQFPFVLIFRRHLWYGSA
ncbi:hypothetical protein [Cohnella nanjingensis]|uniref:Uncharacterized protein n=1 Tax=Cohnella nanjingensis TaxID=1387779 RepID=A0A7X0VF91_9BACL|nr:hypothetical protein [Cohnella nanjingensis]MBB6671797.1 hypothetical protein [Cohnella nanjingensis]